MLYKPHPELSHDYPAIDGIAKTEKEAGRPEEPIRKDIIKIFDDKTFDEWYNPRKDAIENLLELYRLIGSIPDLSLGSDWDVCNLDKRPVIQQQIKILKTGLDYLEKIKQAREEYLSCENHL